MVAVIDDRKRVRERYGFSEQALSRLFRVCCEMDVFVEGVLMPYRKKVDSGMGSGVYYRDWR